MSETTQSGASESTTGGMHERNIHREGYDFPALVLAMPELAKHVIKNPAGRDTVDFTSSEAVKLLNQALLKAHYGIKAWNLPEGYLCPPIPGRAEYIHHIADLLAASNRGEIPKGKRIRFLDIGIGSNAIYPIIAGSQYGWRGVGSDIDEVALENVARIVEQNAGFKRQLELRVQKNPMLIFEGVVQQSEMFDVVWCNPPFNASEAEAIKVTDRKWRQLGKSEMKQTLNFGGQHAELICEGGEEGFISRMIMESTKYKQQVLWFTALVSREASLRKLRSVMRKARPVEYNEIPMQIGNKKSRILVWTWFDQIDRQNWARHYWKL